MTMTAASDVGAVSLCEALIHRVISPQETVCPFHLSLEQETTATCGTAF